MKLSLPLHICNMEYKFLPTILYSKKIYIPSSLVSPVVAESSLGTMLSERERESGWDKMDGGKY